VSDEARLAFMRLLAGDDAAIPLDVACLQIAAHAHPGLDPAPVLAELDHLGMLAHAAMRSAATATAERQRLAALHAVLYEEAGFNGDRLDYYDPRNALLSDVVARRLGIPITLAVVELEVARRCGIALHGIGFPGHFLLGTASGLILDPFDRGRERTHAELRAMLRHGTGPAVDEPGPFPTALLRPATNRGILARILNNLRGMYAGRHDWSSALWAVELLVVLHPRDDHLQRDRAMLLGHAGHFRAATRALERYLDEHPDAADRDTIERALGLFRGRLN
jgi:regulator of sirC expression with transglutaminase-like and TPR domain